MKLTKEQVQKRVLQNKEPLDLDKFTWDEETSTFSSEEEDLVLNFAGIDGVKLTAGNFAWQTAGDSATQTAGCIAGQTAGNDATQEAGNGAMQEAGNGAKQRAGNFAWQTAGGRAKQTAGYKSTHCVGANSQVVTGFESIIHAEGDDVVIFNSNVPEIIFANKGDIIEIAPKGVKGHIKNGIYSVTGEKAVIEDGKIINN